MFRLSSLFLFYGVIMAANHFDVELQTFTCHFNPKFIEFIDCSIKSIADGKKARMSTFVVNGSWSTGVSINEYTMRITMLHKNAKGGWSPYMGARNVSVNICKLFSGKVQSLLLDSVMGNLKKCSNLFHSCPFEGPIYARDCVVDDTRLPPMMAAGDYIAKLAHFTLVNKTEHFMLESIVNLMIKMRSYSGK